MKNIVIWTLLLGCTAYVASQAYQEYAPPDFKIRTETLAQQVRKPQIICGKQIVNLPNDGHKYYTTVFTPASTQSKVVGWFKSNSTLVDLKRRTHYNEVSASDPMYARYKRYHGNSGKTVVLLQDPNGREIYCSARKGLPSTANGLASAIQGDITANCIFRRWRDRAQPQPEPTPEPDDEEVSPDDDEVVEPAEESNDFPFLLAALGLAIGLAFGVGTSYYEQYYKPEA
jgi:hypothetical protein